MVDVKQNLASPGDGLPAKTLETKAGRAARVLNYFGDFHINCKTPAQLAPKDFALRAACT
jgi:hypothetical protein